MSGVATEVVPSSRFDPCTKGPVGSIMLHSVSFRVLSLHRSIFEIRTDINIIQSHGGEEYPTYNKKKEG
jgi:hypothetical protein